MSTSNELEIENSALYELLRERLVLPDVVPESEESGLVILIEGKPGTGKSTLALQLLDTIDFKNSSCQRIFHSIEQLDNEVENKYIKMTAAKLLASIWKDGDGSMRVSQGSFQGLTENELGKLLGELKEPLAAYWDHKEKENREQGLVGSSLSHIHQQVQEAIRVRFGARILFGMRPPLPTGSFSRSRSKIEERLQQIVDKLNTPNQSGEENGQAKGRKPLVVVDGLSLFSPTDRAALNFQQLVEVIRRTCQVGILVYEPGSNEGGSIEHHVDMIIELGERWTEKPQAYLFHELWIRKSRYQDAALGRHQYKIRDFGIEVFPSIHFQVHQPNYMGKELERSMQPSRPNDPPIEKKLDPSPIQDPSVVDRLGNIQEGDSTVLLGPRGTFKTELCLDFLCRGNWGCARCKEETAEHSLLVSMIGNGYQTHGGHVYTFHQRPGFISPAEFLSFIRRRLKAQKDRHHKAIKRFVLWDLTQLDYRFPLFGQDSMFLTALMDHLKAEGIKSLFMGAGNARYSAAASAMADNVIFCWRETTDPLTASLTPQAGQPSAKNKRLILYVDRLSKDEHLRKGRLHVLDVEDIRESLLGKSKLEAIEEEALRGRDKATLRLVTNKQGFQV
jgi:KaiC/GvpD/RAD55 family RecA-like ATPase